MQATNFGLVAHSRWAPAMLIPIVAVALYFDGRRTERPYSLISVIVLAAGGILVSLLNPAERIAAFAPAAWGGLWLLSMGLAKLLKYLHQHPRPEGVRA